LLEVEPDYARAHATCGWAYMLSARPDEGIASIERALALGPTSSLVKAQLGQAYAMVGQRDKAKALLAELTDRAQTTYVPPYHFAYIHTGLGDADRAMDYLERAYEIRAGAIYGINGSFLFASLRSNSRFLSLLKRMNLA
jgi:serine/threonine-protein kinase